MMGGGGSIQGMRNSLNINNKLLRKKRYFKRRKSFLKSKVDYTRAGGGLDKLKSASPEQLAAIRKKVIRQRRIELIPTFLISLVAFFFIGYFIYDFTITNIKTEINQADQSLLAKQEKYLWFISEADNYLKKGKWHNAVFQYKKAIELFPKEYNGRYRLAYAQTYRCRNEKENCEIAIESVNELLRQFPDKQELIELENVLIFVDY